MKKRAKTEFNSTGHRHLSRGVQSPIVGQRKKKKTSKNPDKLSKKKLLMMMRKKTIHLYEICEVGPPYTDTHTLIHNDTTMRI